MMRTFSLDRKLIDEYLLKIKGYVDELADVGVSVRHEEYVDALLKGLWSDYAPAISVIESKNRMPSIAKIEALLYDHETRLVRYNKETQGLSSPSLNYTLGYLNSNSYKSGDSDGSRGLYGRGGGNRGGFADHGSGGRFANFQCQICLRYGYTANVCHFQSDMSFQPMNPSPSLIQIHFNLLPTPLVLSEPPTLGLIPIPSLELLLQPQDSQVLCSPIPTLMEMLTPPGFQILVLVSM